MNYNQITMVQRYQIEALIKEGLSKSCIAKNLGVHRSTIYREINRNSIDGYYKAEYAQIQTRLRYQRKTKNLKITKRHQKYIFKHLKQGWSPEQISGRMPIDGLNSLSHETIYRFIYKKIGNKTLVSKQKEVKYRQFKFKVRQGG